jgi:hypothetical protein
MPTVCNIRGKPRGWKPEPGEGVYIGRPGSWGNPFEIGRHGDRDEVVRKYRAWLLGQPELVAKARRELAGKDLWCWCAPLRCHGDVLLAVANEDPEP